MPDARLTTVATCRTACTAYPGTWEDGPHETDSGRFEAVAGSHRPPLEPYLRERTALFRKTDKTPEQARTDEASAAAVKPAGKGHPTPTRREAEAAAKARAKASAGRDAKTAKRLNRERRADASRRAREGIRAGDERYLPERDKGPVKRFIRDYVDSRLTFIELMVPIMIIVLVLMTTDNERVNAIASQVWGVTMLVAIMDSVWLVVRTRKAIRATLPDQPLKGVTSYTLLRALQLRFMRLPKPQVRIGGRPR